MNNVNNVLENKIVNLEEQPSNNEQYHRPNNVEISGISNQIPDQDLEENIKICRDSDINMSPMDTKGCHRLPLGRNYTNTTKPVVMSKNKVFVTHSSCPYWKQSGNQDLSWKRPDGIPGMHGRFWVKDYLLFSVLSIVIVNFRLYTNPWQTFGTDPWQATASSF